MSDHISKLRAVLANPVMDPYSNVLKVGTKDDWLIALSANSLYFVDPCFAIRVLLSCYICMCLHVQPTNHHALMCGWQVQPSRPSPEQALTNALWTRVATQEQVRASINYTCALCSYNPALLDFLGKPTPCAPCASLPFVLIVVLIFVFSLNHLYTRWSTA